jgi:DNA-damage-inducible protein J
LEAVIVMATTNINFRLDEDLKEEAELTAQAMGVSVSAVLTMFLKKFVNDGKLPFVPEASDEDKRLIAERKHIMAGFKAIEDGDYYDNMSEFAKKVGYTGDKL